MKFSALLFLLAFTGVSARASVVYDFAGTPFGVSFDLAFQLTTPDVVDPPMDGGFVGFTCGQLDSSTNCGVSAGVFPGRITFSNQSVLAPFSAQLTFDANDNVEYAFDFPTGAFAKSGTFQSDTSLNRNPATLTVSQNPEPATLFLSLSGICLSGLLTRRLRPGNRRPPGALYGQARGAGYRLHSTSARQTRMLA